MCEITEPIHCLIIAFLLLIQYLHCDRLLTFGLEPLQRIACDVMKLGTKFELNRAIRGEVIGKSAEFGLSFPFEGFRFPK